MADVLLGTLEVSLPVFAMVFVGALLKRLGWIDQAFVNTASSLVFKATMPTLLFLSILRADPDMALNLGLVGFYLGVSTLAFGLIWLWALPRCPHDDRGVFVQGAFRGNCGIVGLALSASMYGDLGLSLGGIMAGAIIVLNLVLSAIVLAVYSPTVSSHPLAILRDVAANPLILGIVAALPLNYLGVQLPAWLMTSGDYLASLSLPLALICIGGGLSVSAARQSSALSLEASLWKVVLMPALGILLALPLGFRGAELGILFLFLGSPSAAVAYVMARGAGANATLAASIIVISTLLSLLTISAGLFTLTTFGLI
ncbi:AEC family transporter [Halomonas sp. M4R1S46]|uniref:AEC family transporter n=1 Tax=Halomonas sp. M4R1S46 TaxID=2982692 RepID=UPI0021E43F8B|nr:AEC family transporter [Halomonas sp. M4R1S46]UYG08582.1 AEC family transporter [Halomonas sp. M4R1S46]